MRIAAKYSHLNGYEWILVHQGGLWREIEATIESVDARFPKSGRRDDRTNRVRSLKVANDLKKQFVRQLTHTEGWNEGRASQSFTDEDGLTRRKFRSPSHAQKMEPFESGRRPVLPDFRSDFVKHRVSVEFQIGKDRWNFYDLFAKHLAFFVGNAIDVRVEILPMKEMQTLMSSGPGYYEGALYDLARQGRDVPAVPLVLIGVTA